MTVEMSFDTLDLAGVRKDVSRIAESSLARLTNPRTFSLARECADSGAVTELATTRNPMLLVGRVRGLRPTPYKSTVKITRAASGTVTSITGACSCSVAVNCEHVFALAMVAVRRMQKADPQFGDVTNDGDALGSTESLGTAELPSSPREAAKSATAKSLTALRRPRPGVAPGSADRRAGQNVQTKVQPPAWQRSVSALLGGDAPPASSTGAPLGLQVELTRTSPGRGPATSVPAVRVGLRPVMQGAKGGWIRTGISWDSLSAYNYRTSAPRADHVQLLREINAVNSTFTRGDYYGYRDKFIYLDSLNTRRIWDLLTEARNQGMALVQSGKGQRPVTLSDGQAEVALEIRRADNGLVIEPKALVDGEPTPMANFALLGDPAHGLALWPESGDANLNSSGLTLVRSDQQMSAEMQKFLTQSKISIPAQDEQVFLAEFLPRLARRVPLVSFDDAIEIPEVEPPRLSLTVTGLPEHCAEVLWEWHYRSGGTLHTLALRQTGPESIPRDGDAERRALDTLGLTESDLGPLTEPSHLGPLLKSTVTLHGRNAIAFFGGTLPRLREVPDLDVTVLNEQFYRQAVQAPVITISNSQRGDDHDWFDLGFTVSIEGQQVPFNGLFLALAAGEEYMILPSGTFFALDCEPFLTLRRLIEEARSLEDVPGRSLKINRYQASLWNDLQEIGVVTAEAAAWKKSVGGLLAGDQITDRPLPDALSADLRPYQQTGFNWLAFLFDRDLGGILADDMGLGKTVQTLALICYARQSRPDAAPFLVVAPTSVVGNWAAECRKFAPDLRVVAVTETLSRGGVDLETMVCGADIIVTSYALFRLDYDDYSAQRWSGLILDEAQFIKNHLSKGYACAKKLVAPFKLAITGTPMENNLLELWSMFSLTSPGLFSRADRFKEYYQGPIEKAGDSERLNQLRRRIRPLMLRRTKEQVAPDLPAKQEQVIELELNPQHRKVYQRHLQRERQKVLGLIDDMTKNRFAIFRSLTVLRQLSLDASLVDPKYSTIPSTKLDALMEQVADIIAEGHRTLIFSQLTGYLDKVRQRMADSGIEYCYLDGSTRNRPAVLAEFKSGTAPVFLISLKAGGVGLNLTEADYCILLDPWWNPATEEQAIDRIHRIGQTKNVMVYRLVAKDTIEEKVMALKATKAKLFSSVMESGDAQATALTAADIRELLG